MKNKKLAYDVNEMPPAGKSIILALQHVFAMFGATVLVPILVNASIAEAGVEGQALSIAVALVTAGLGTLIYIACTRAKSPVFLGSSFAFIAPIAAAYVAGGIAGAMTGVMVIGLIYFIVSMIIRFAGKAWIDKLLPPIVIGPMIMIIGLGLAGSAVGNIFDTSIAVEGIAWKGPVVALITFLTTAIVMTRAKGFFKIIPFLVGIVVGYIAACAFGMVNFDAVKVAAWLQMPEFKIPYVHYKPAFLIALTMAPIALVTMAEHIGDHKALSTIMDRDLLKDPGLENTLMGDGLATFLAGFLGGPSNTTYGENTAVVGMTRNASVGVIALAAVFAVILGFLGKFTALVQTIPTPVLGGVSLLLYGFIAVNGLKVLIQNNTDFSKNKNVIVASAMLVLGLGGAAFSIATGNGMAVQISGMSLAAIVGILLNLIIPTEEDEEVVELVNNRTAVEELKESIKDELTVELKGEILEEIKREIIKEKKGK
ncbi:MAG: uracil-xanthine permease [Bacilli bacterium]|nr:uracil-xanthine permease [Bacilli bacterium]